MRQLRMSNELAAAVTAWAKRQADQPSWSAAIGRLVEHGLAATEKARTGAHKGASKARDMAAREVDKVMDRSATAAEQVKRKRQLTKGPTEFRDLRGDQPKNKG